MIALLQEPEKGNHGILHGSTFALFAPFRRCWLVAGTCSWSLSSARGLSGLRGMEVPEVPDLI